MTQGRVTVISTKPTTTLTTARSDATNAGVMPPRACRKQDNENSTKPMPVCCGRMLARSAAASRRLWRAQRNTAGCRLAVVRDTKWLHQVYMESTTSTRARAHETCVPMHNKAEAAIFHSAAVSLTYVAKLQDSVTKRLTTFFTGYLLHGLLYGLSCRTL